MTKRTINIGQYNGLYASAEVGLQESWRNLGLTSEEVNERADNNKSLELHDTMPNSYFLYKVSANQIVDDILEQLDIEVTNE